MFSKYITASTLVLLDTDGTQDKTVNVEVPEVPNTTPSTVAAVEVVDEAVGVTPPSGRGWYFNAEDDRYSFCESESTDNSR